MLLLAAPSNLMLCPASSTLLFFFSWVSLSLFVLLYVVGVVVDCIVLTHLLMSLVIASLLDLMCRLSLRPFWCNVHCWKVHI